MNPENATGSPSREPAITITETDRTSFSHEPPPMSTADIVSTRLAYIGTDNEVEARILEQRFVDEADFTIEDLDALALDRLDRIEADRFREADPTVSIFEALGEPESKPVYRIEHVLVADALVQLSSDPGMGKTALLIGTALHLAAGRDFLGLRIPAAVPVLFWQAEGSRASFKLRVATAATNYGIELRGLPFRITKKRTTPADFASPAFREAVAASEAKVVICDTRRFFAPKANENDATDFMNMIVAPLKAIAAELQVAFVVTTHYGKPNDQRSGTHKTRGTSAQQGDFDVLVRLEAPNGKTAPGRVLEFDKIRDEADLDPRPILFEKDKTIFTVDATPLVSLTKTERDLIDITEAVTRWPRLTGGALLLKMQDEGQGMKKGDFYAALKLGKDEKRLDGPPWTIHVPSGSHALLLVEGGKP